MRSRYSDYATGERVRCSVSGRDRTLLQIFKAGFRAHPVSLLRVPEILPAEVNILIRNLTTGVA